MLCQLCKNNEATIKISYMLANNKNEMNLCRECAEDKGIDNPFTSLPKIFENFIVEILSQEPIDAVNADDEEDHAKCSGCGTTWNSFQKTGLLGCEICYQVFKEELNILLRRIHGSNKHIGSRPRSQRSNIAVSELKRIQMELQEAINSENFELAAQLRDLIRDAQGELQKNENDGILR